MEKNKIGVYDYIEEINGKFGGEKSDNETLEKEVEFKVFVDGEYSKEEVKNIHSNLQKEILSILKGKIIFDGNITDTRYYDTENKDTSFLNENNISMIRIRNQANLGKQNFIYTVKKIDENNENLEYEKEVDENYGENLEEKGLKKIKKSSKYRKEIKFFVYIKGKEEEVKIAFDEYREKNKSDGDFYEDNSEILPFFEVEAKNLEISKKGFKEIKKLKSFNDIEVKITTGGPKILKNQNYRENDKKDLNKILSIDNEKKIKAEKEITFFNKLIIESIFNIIENEDIFKASEIFLEGNEYVNEKEYLYNDKLKRVFKKLLRSGIKDLIKIDEGLERYFHRINDGKKEGKKFFDKFEREYSGYIKSFLSVILKEYKIRIKNNENLSILEKSKIILDTINVKKDSFIKCLFLFDDSLTKEELGKVLEKLNKTIDKDFNSYKGDILKILSQYNFQKKDLGTNKKIVLDGLLTLYGRANASTVYSGDKMGNPEEIEKKVEEIISEQFEYLAKQFSIWLNSPNRNEKEFEKIKELYLRTYYRIYVLNKTGIVFEKISNKNFDENLIEEINNKFKNSIYNSSSFIVKDEGIHELRIFLKNIFNDTKKTSENILKNFKEYNNEHNIKIGKIYNKKNIEKINLFKSKIEEGKNKKEISKFINFDLWSNLDSENRLNIFIKYVLKVNKNGFSINSYILSGKDLKYNSEFVKEFIKIEFEKINNFYESSEEYSENFNKYSELVKKQLNYIRNYFKNNSIENLSEGEKIAYFVKNNINSYQLLVTLFHHKLKSIQGTNIEENKLYPVNFSESIIKELYKNKLLEKSGTEFITSTSSAYNSTSWDENTIEELYERIGNNKSVNVGDSFYFEKKGKKMFFKDFKKLFIPKDGEIDYEKSRKFCKEGIITLRELLNGDTKNINKDYLNILKETGINLKNQSELKKLLEFIKLIYKIFLPIIEKICNKLGDSTSDFAENFYKDIQKNGEHKSIKDIKIAQPKSFERIFEKVITKYYGNIPKLSDGTRATIYGENFKDLSYKMSNFITKQLKGPNVKSIRFEDKIGNPFKKAERINGYRDATIVITFKDGSTAEVQFHFNAYHYIKTGDLQIINKGGKKYLNFYDNEYPIGELLKSEGEKLTLDEKIEINDYCIENNIKLPKAFIELLDFKDSKIENLQSDNLTKFNADFTYNLERTLGNINGNIKIKLQKLDLILFGHIAAGEVASKELERIMEK